MSNKAYEKHKLKEIEERLAKTRHTLEGIIPIWNQVDRRKRQLELDIKLMEDERLKLLNGQTVMRFDLDF